MNELMGLPYNYQRVVNSGAGGTTLVEAVVPPGELWLVKYMCGYHNDGAAPRTTAFYLLDPIGTNTIEMAAGISVASGVRNLYPLGTNFHKGIVLSPGGLNLRFTVYSAAAGVNCTMELHVHVIKGAWPLV